MKKILLSGFLALLSAASYSQSTVLIRGDSVKIYKSGGSAELILENVTRSKPGAYLKNVSNGRTGFFYAVDSAYISGSDLILVRGSGTQNITIPISTSTPGIDDVLAVGQNIGANRTIALNTFNVNVDATTFGSDTLKLNNGAVFSQRNPYSDGRTWETTIGGYSVGNTMTFRATGLYSGANGGNTMEFRWLNNHATSGGSDTLLHAMGIHHGWVDNHFYLADFTDSPDNGAGQLGAPNRRMTVEKNGTDFMTWTNNGLNNNAQVWIGYYPSWYFNAGDPRFGFETYRLVIGEKTAIRDTVDFNSTALYLQGHTASRPLKLDADKKIISTQIDLASSNDVTGILPVANGGTGSSSGVSIATGTTPLTGGADKQVLFNDAGVINSNAALTFDKTAKTLTIGDNFANGVIVAQAINTPSFQGGTALMQMYANDSEGRINSVHPTNGYRQMHLTGSVIDLDYGTAGFTSNKRLRVNAGGVTINPNLEDVDFVISSDINANAFFLDGANSDITIGGILRMPYNLSLISGSGGSADGYLIINDGAYGNNVTIYPSESNARAAFYSTKPFWFRNSVAVFDNFLAVYNSSVATMFSADNAGNGYFAGNVGIGNTSPSARLQLSSNALKAFSTGSSATGSYVEKFYIDSTGKIARYQNATISDGEILIGNTSTGKFDKATLQSAGGSISIGNAGGTINLETSVALASGTYTPTLTNTTNVAASTAYAWQYLRVGETIHVSGKVDIDPTATGAVELRFDLPITTGMGFDYQLAGTANAHAVAAESASVIGVVATGGGAIKFIAVDLTNKTYTITFTYKYVAP